MPILQYMKPHTVRWQRYTNRVFFCKNKVSSSKYVLDSLFECANIHEGRDNKSVDYNSYDLHDGIGNQNYCSEFFNLLGRTKSFWPYLQTKIRICIRHLSKFLKYLKTIVKLGSLVFYHTQRSPILPKWLLSVVTFYQELDSKYFSLVFHSQFSCYYKIFQSK